MKKIVWILVITAGLIGLAFFNGLIERGMASTSGGELVIFHAGSLSVPLGQVCAVFEEEHPGITVKAEASGSRQAARKICDLGRECDIMASADYKVVANLLMPEYADFNIRFALNEMAIAYTETSAFAGEINAENWPEILLRDGVAFGRSDPDADPCGYRTLMVFQLAQKYYAIEGLAASLQKKDRYIRPKETDLLALLEAGEIDYVFIYRSVAAQHGLKMVLLDEAINLKSQDHAELYRTAKVNVSGKKPGELITRTGEAMVYSVTIPKNSPNRKAAEAWVELLLSPRGRAIMEANGQRCLEPAEADGFDRLPDGARRFCKQI